MTKKIFIISIITEIILLLCFFYILSFKITQSLNSEKNNNQNKTSLVTPISDNIEITGWFASFDSKEAPMVLPYTINNFHTFSPMLYRIMPDSSLGRHNIDEREEIIQISQNHNIPIAPVITDESDYIRVKRLLTSTSIQTKFIQQLVAEAISEDFIGWSIDIENVESSDRDDFSVFVKNLSEELHKNNLKLFVIVYGRQEKETYDPALAHDYETLGKYVDQIQIMTYNYNNEFTDPGSQTPLDWYRLVLGYATKVVTKEKILVGLSTHGYDWGKDSVEGLTYSEVKDKVVQSNATITYNSQQSAEVASYIDNSGQKHEIWFEDSKSIIEKIKIAQSEFGINKFALWRLSAEDPTVWDKISEIKN